VTALVLFATAHAGIMFDPSMLVTPQKIVNPPALVRQVPSIARQMPLGIEVPGLFKSPKLVETPKAPPKPAVNDPGFVEGVKREKNYNDVSTPSFRRPTTDGTISKRGATNPYSETYPAIGERPQGGQATGTAVAKMDNRDVSRPYKPGPSYALTGNEKYELFKNDLKPQVVTSPDVNDALVANVRRDQGVYNQLAEESPTSPDLGNVVGAGLIGFFVGSAATLALFYKRSPVTEATEPLLLA